MFEKECNGVRIWQYIRTYTYQIVLQKILDYQTTQTTILRAIPHGEYLKSFSGWYEYRIRRNILFAHKRDVLIFSSPFRTEDGEYYYKDIHTAEIDARLNRTHYVLDRRVSPTSIVLNRSRNMLTYDTPSFDKLFRIKKEKRANKHELEKYFLLPLETEFNIQFSLREKKTILDYANSRVFYDRSLTEYCRYLIERIKPKVILFVCLSDLINQIVCCVAKEYGIPTIEYQHGNIFESIPYCFFHNDIITLDGFPDYFFSYGEYERDTSRMPIPRERVIPVGSPEIDKMIVKESPDDLVNSKKIILFISSFTTETAIMAKGLYEVLDQNKYEIWFKLHPKEIMTWEAKVGLILKNTSIRVIDELDSIHNYLGKVDWVVGTASTALFEATCYDKIKIAYINNYCAENHPLIEKGRAVPVYNVDDLREEIETDSFTHSKYQFYATNSIEKINQTIERIITGHDAC